MSFLLPIRSYAHMLICLVEVPLPPRFWLLTTQSRVASTFGILSRSCVCALPLALSLRRRFKRDDPVEVPATFTRYDRLTEGAQGQEAVYDLFAWTDHHGSDGSHGHYTAHSRHFNGAFYKCVLLSI